ncbi:metallopeptidase family protein [Microlunatus elymi]|uniref:Metallopeptidase family protein n=1 Tax=Microlunatus elymi TaxID=2596828 RepID=A0A516Q4L0_9ACTN|nr:metallopeptidase family protein [Microlunatus elymi]QDP98383.1 metallopeptidase family protein [Microlunatus elymi]
MPITMPADDFDRLVERALADVPRALADLIDNVVIMVEDWPPPGGPYLLGLYHGVPLTERDHNYAGVLPDRITIFRGTILQICNTAEEVVHEVHITVVHEIAHHFGISDDQLHRLGYG